MKSSLEIPLENIESVSFGKLEERWKSIGAPGTYFPGLINAGTYHTPAGTEFWYAAKGKLFLTIKLKGE